MKDKPSFTAETMALQRAFESHRAPTSRLFEDPYADGFTHGALRFLALTSRLPRVGRLAPLLYDTIAGAGPRPSAIVRTRLIDDVVATTRPDVGQVVILGAGFDTRAHRLASLADVAVFEVDHPATQVRKRSIAERSGLSGRHVVYVPVDFERDRFEELLLAARFDANVPALFIWEGVTNYLTADAVNESLLAIRRLCCTGGTLVFTYIQAGVLDGTAFFPETARWLRAVERAGEPWTFGLHPEEVATFLAQRGFDLQSDCSTKEAGKHLFAAQGRTEQGSDLYHVAVAVMR